MTSRLTSATNDKTEVALTETKIFEQDDNVMETEKALQEISRSGNTPKNTIFFPKFLSDLTLLVNVKTSSPGFLGTSCVEVYTNPGMDKCGDSCTESFPVCRQDSGKNHQYQKFSILEKSKSFHFEKIYNFVVSRKLVMYKNSHVTPRFGCEKKRAVSMPNTISTLPNTHVFQATTNWSKFNIDLGISRLQAKSIQLGSEESSKKNTVFTLEFPYISRNMDRGFASRSSCTIYTSKEDKQSGKKSEKMEDPGWNLKCDNLIGEKNFWDTPKVYGNKVSKSGNTQVSTNHIGTYTNDSTCLDEHKEPGEEYSAKCESPNKSHLSLCIDGVSLWMLRGMYSQAYSSSHVSKGGSNQEREQRKKRPNETEKYDLDVNVPKLSGTEGMVEAPYPHGGFLSGFSRVHVVCLEIPLKAPAPKVPINIAQLVLSLE